MFVLVVMQIILPHNNVYLKHYIETRKINLALRRKILQSVDCVSHILRRYLTTAKGQRTNAIYYIPCNECDNEYDNEYIGQIKRQFSTRLKEHQKAVFFRQK